jgi:hypothetical protein
MILSELDRQLAELRDRHPAWRVWYVPRIGGTTWCAQPEPTLQADSAEALSEAIREVEDGE